MKKIIFTCYIIITLTNIQAQWYQTNGPNGGEIRSVILKDSDIFLIGNLRIFSSSDNGTSWLSRGSFGKIDITALYNDSLNIYAGTNNGEIFISSDKGLSWTVTNIDSSNHLVVRSISKINSRIIIGTDHGIFISDNYGKVWLGTNMYSLWDIQSLYISGETIYAATSAGLYFSKNYGIDWVQTNFGFNVRSVVVSGSSIIVATTEGIFRSTDNGNNWERTLTNYKYDVHFLSEYGSNIFAGTYQGLYVTMDVGESWQLLGLSDFDVESLAISSETQTIYAGTTHGLFLSTDFGTNWTASGLPLSSSGSPLFSANSLTFHNGIIFAATGYGGVYSSSNGGNNWIYKGLAGKGIYSIVSDSTNIYAGSINCIYISSDNGLNWVQVNSELYGLITSIYIKGLNIFAGSYSGIFLSVDKGKSWTKTKINSFHGLAINDISSIGPNLVAGNWDGLYLSSDNGLNWNFIVNMHEISSFVLKGTEIFAACSDGLYVSSDNGYTWTARYTNYEGHAISFYGGFAANEDNFFAAGNGVYLSTDEGYNWKNVNAGFPYGSDNLFVAPLLVDSLYIYAWLSNYGIWKCSLSQMVTKIKKSEDLPTKYYLAQNYPNPFNPTTTIEYFIPRHALVKLEIFDILGRKVETLVNKEQDVGDYSVTFYCSKLSSGIYLYKITTADFVQTRKMVLIKQTKT